tara:strand:+ start:2694 stop:2876 length:183 start_codon:yes stop_codon:yes gene_type:complete
MSGLFRDLILIAMGANLAMFAGGALLNSNDLMFLSVLNILMLGVGLTVRDHLKDGSEKNE